MNKPTQSTCLRFHRSFARCCALSALVTLASSALACGAKTGLRVPDATIDAQSQDSSDVVDAMDAPDVRDVIDVTDAIEGEDAAPMCVPGRFDLLRTSAEIMFVFDRSGSMAFALDGGRAFPGFPARWVVLREALAGSLPTIERTLPFGAKFFPRVLDPLDNDPPSFTCQLDPGAELIAPALNNTAAVLRVFDTTDPVGPTPTFSAIDQTARFLRARATRGVSRAILLATDGGPNCNGALALPCRCTSNQAGACSIATPDGQFACLDQMRTVDLIREVAQPTTAGVQPIPVFVVGIDAPVDRSPDFRDVLEAMAQAGGRARHVMGRPGYYSIQRAEDFTEAFTEVARSVARCAFVTPSRPDDPNAIDVELDGALIARDPTRTEGWDWTDAANGELTFFGAACAQASVNGVRVNARIGCRDR